MSELVTAVGEKLDYFLTLPADWNNYGADQINKKIVADVREFVAKLPSEVPLPFVVPLHDGGIQLAWNCLRKKQGIYLDFVFAPYHAGIVKYVVTDTDRIKEGGYSTGDFHIGDINRAMRFIKQVVGEVDDDEHDHDPFYGDGD